jgi:HSP20 family protein
MTTKELVRPKTAEAAQQQQALQAPRRLNPFDVLQQEIDRVFDRFNGFSAWPTIFREPWPSALGERGFSPSMEVTETDNAIEVSTELPGMDEKDVEISVADGVLTIRGEKKFEKDEKKKNYRVVERSYGSFERAVALPSGVDASKVKAKMTKGVLKVEIPKPAAAKAQQVKITAD